jgi:carboxymethylenebutenolidase
MKKFVLLLFFIHGIVFAQQKSCCKTTTNENFVQLASTENFASFHLAPEPFIFTPESGKMINFECSDNVKANAFEIRSSKETDKWLFIFHEWWGLNDYIKRTAEEYSKEFENVNIIAIDLYDGVVAATPDEAQQAMQKVKDERARAIINGAIKHAGKNAKIATLGWCFGGGWSLQSAIMEGKQAIACVMYYGMPETDIEKLKTLNTDVLGIFASKDAWLTPEVVSTFEKNMKKAGKKITIKSYDADHAFANPSNPKFDRVAAADAHLIVVAYLKEKMK